MINITFSGEAVNVLAEMRTFLAGGMSASMPVSSEGGPPTPAEVSPPAKASRGRSRTKRPETDQPVTDIDENGDAVAEQAEPEILTSKEPEFPAVADDEVRNAVREYIKAKGENATFALLQSFEVKNATTAIESGKAPALVAKIRAELAEDAAA